MTEPVAPADEAPHPPGPEELWGESWYLDWAAPDAGYGGYVRLGLYPNLGVAWWWVALTGAARPTVLVVEHRLPLPAPAGATTVDGRGQHVALDVDEPLARVRVRASGPGVRLADPADAFRGLDGERVGVALDLTWESRAEPFPYAMATRYEITSDVRGTVLVDGEEVAVDCPGQRDHSWGVRDWWLFPWNWTSGRLDDGTAFHAARSIIPDLELFATGYVVGAGGGLRPAGPEEVSVEVGVDGDALPRRARHRIGSLELAAAPAGHAPILLVAPDGRETRFARALCRFTSSDGRGGTGWTEYNWPPGFPPDRASG